MKTVKVVAAIIKAVNENGETIIFATQRGYGDFKDELNNVEWLPADITLIEKIRNLLSMTR